MSEYSDYAKREQIRRIATYVNGKLVSVTSDRDHAAYCLELYASENPGKLVLQRVYTANQIEDQTL